MNGLRLSMAKTVVVHFCRRRRPYPDFAIKLHGELIQVRPEVKFFGIMMDSRLTYKSYLKTLGDKCLKALNVLKSVARTSYGSDRKTLVLPYRSLIRSKMDYACFIYDNTHDSTKRILDAVHHAAVRISIGAFRTTPSASLLVEADEPPLALR